MEDTAIYRKTDKGKQEVADRVFGLENEARRLLIMIDGQRDTAELSVYVRAGELESALVRSRIRAVHLGEKRLSAFTTSLGRLGTSYAPVSSDFVSRPLR